MPKRISKTISAGRKKVVPASVPHEPWLIARKSKLTREATYRMLSKSGNPELRSLKAILGAAGLRLSVRPIEQRLRRAA